MEIKDKNIILMCEGGCYEHNLIFRQTSDYKATEYDKEIYVAIHVDKPPFWKRLRYAITGKFSKNWSEYVELITTKEKLQDVINQLE